MDLSRWNDDPRAPLWAACIVGGALLFVMSYAGFTAALAVGVVIGVGAIPHLLRLKASPAPVSASAGAELSAKHDELRTLQELIGRNIAASVVLSDAAARVRYCNAYTEVLTGFPLDYIMAFPGDFFASRVHDGDREAFTRARNLAALCEDTSVVSRLVHRSGVLLWLETRFVPVCAYGRLESLLAVSVDVSEAVNYRKRIEEQNQDLRDFASMASHDLKAPLFTIGGMASALLQDYGPVLGEEGRDLVGYISSATTRLEALVASIIEYSALATVPMDAGPVDVAGVMNEVIADHEAQIAESGATLTVDPALPAVRGNRVRVYQVFSNLIGNALKYSSPERTPHITVESRVESGKTAAITVRDNGLGMPQSKLQEIFRPFVRLKGTSAEGTGVGLAAVKKIMDRLDGSVEVQSEEGRGSAFTVRFRGV